MKRGLKAKTLRMKDSADRDVTNSSPSQPTHFPRVTYGSHVIEAVDCQVFLIRLMTEQRRESATLVTKVSGLARHLNI